MGPGPFLRVVPPTQKKRYGQLNSTHTSGFCFTGRRFTYPLFLAYECCRFKSKSFSRFLLCSLLQTSPSPCFSSSPSSSCLLWVLVGWSEQVCTVNFKSRFFILVEFFALLFYIYFFLMFVDLLTHTGAGSERAGGVLTLVGGVTADNRHFHPHWMI